MTDSQVTFQGIPYEFCSNESSLFPEPNCYFLHMPLNIVYRYNCVKHFYDKVITEEKKSLLIKNIAFVLYTHSDVKLSDSYINIVLFISANSWSSHQTTLENTSWCLKYLGSSSGHLSKVGEYKNIFWQIKPGFQPGRCHIHIVNAYMHYDDPSLWPETAMTFRSANITLNGNNYFAIKRGATMEVTASNFDHFWKPDYVWCIWFLH